MINNKPNIFEFATKELSQDAVFMYLFDCFNSDNHEEKKVGKDFLDLIYQTQNKKIEKSIKKLIIKKQYHSIDVLVLVEYEDNTNDVIILEDKTYSSEHDNQLKRYYDDIKKDGVDGRKASNIYGVYFKLGNLKSDEEKALKIDNGVFEYKVLNYNTFQDYLNQHQNINFILQSIYEFYENRLFYINQIDNADFSNPSDLDFNTVLSDWYSQDVYFGWIIQKVIGKDYHRENQYPVDNYGRPCTQYRFVFTEEDVKNPNWDCIPNGNISKYCYFFRIDSNSKGWYIAINQYEGSGDKNWDEKKQDRDIIRDSISNIIKKNGVVDNTDDRGKKESKICLFTIESFDDVNDKFISMLTEIYNKVLELAKKQKQ